MIIPLHVDVPMYRWPIANMAIIAVTSLISLSILFSSSGIDGARDLVLTGLQPSGLFGHLLVHGDLMHLIGNMLFLWVFGNAVCAKIGNIAYLGTYLAMGLTAALAHLVFSGDPAIGASGAINGIVGLFLILYPLNDITCGYWWFYHGGSFTVSSIWMILFWLAFDLWGVVGGGGHTAYWAHLGGFASGAGLGVLLLHLGWIEMSRDERSLLHVIKEGA